MARYAIEVMYDGTRFHGSQLQHDLPTVQLAINKALSTLLRTPIACYGASRTDEGVHALCNFYHFDIEQPFTFDLVYRCNALLPEGISIRKLYAARPDFNARFEATARRYRYRIYTRKNPFLLNRAMYLPLRIDRRVLEETAEILKEYTHFESFAKRNSQSATFTCKISHSYWEDFGEELHYVVEANRFLRGMVRGLVATQLEVAKGKMTVDEFRKVIEANDCTKAFFDAPGHGLYLEHIAYPASSFL